MRAQHVRAADPLPVYEQALLGGDATLRGFKLGYRSGDRLLAGSAEIRVPLSTPRRLTRLGVAVFADTGTVYGAGDPVDGATWDTGVGAGVFMQGPAGWPAPRRRPRPGLGHAGALHPGRDVLSTSSSLVEGDEIATGPLSVEMRTTVGPVPSSTERPRSSQSLRPARHASPLQDHGECPEDSTRTPD